MTDRRRRELTADEIRQRTAAGRKSRTDAQTPTGVLSFALGHQSQPGANDGQVRSVPLWSAAVARLNARPPADGEFQVLGGAEAEREQRARRGR